MIEIIASSMCITKKKVVSISEVENIIFKYRAPNKRMVLYINHYKNEERKYYFWLNSSPWFTEYEVDYFDKEIKKLWRK